MITVNNVSLRFGTKTLFEDVNLKFNDGNCYGFSYLTKAIYLNKLPVSAPADDGSPIANNSALIEYTLTETNKKRLSKGNVASIKLNKYYNIFLSSELPDDFRDRVVDGIPYLKEEYANAASSLGYTPYIKEVSPPVEITINGETGTYNKYQSIGDINAFDAHVDEKYVDDYQILQLINRNLRVQKNHALDILKDTIEKQKQRVRFFNYDKELKKTIDELSTGSPALISIDCSLGAHSVLATKVYKVNDMEEYIMGIYDSNTPLEEGQAYFTRQTPYEKNNFLSYYSFSYEGGNLQFTRFLYAGEY